MHLDQRKALRREQDCEFPILEILDFGRRQLCCVTQFVNLLASRTYRLTHRVIGAEP